MPYILGTTKDFLRDFRILPLTTCAVSSSSILKLSGFRTWHYSLFLSQCTAYRQAQLRHTFFPNLSVNSLSFHFIIWLDFYLIQHAKFGLPPLLLPFLFLCMASSLLFALPSQNTLNTIFIPNSQCTYRLLLYSNSSLEFLSVRLIPFMFLPTHISKVFNFL